VNGPINVMVLETMPGDIGKLADQILIGGNFTQIQPRGAPSPFTCYNIARLNPDGSPDTEFYPSLNGQVYAMALQPDGANPPKVIVAGAFSTVNGAPCSNIARLNANGTLDTSFHQPILTGNYNVSDVYALAVQPDGSIILGGQFTKITSYGQKSATPRAHIARLTPAGDLDTGFDPEASAAVLALAVQPDGAVVVAGGFTTLAPGAATASVTPVTRNYIARVNADGTLDSTFNPNSNKAVSVITLQPDGKILIGGNFDTLQPNGAATATTTPDFARLNSDGSLDTSFDEPDPNGQVYAITVQPDGRILIGGNFFSLQPPSTPNTESGEQIVRLNPDGTLDEPFIVNLGVNGNVNAIIVQPDNQVVAAGNFNQINAPGSPTLCGNIARFDANGLEDVTFDPASTNNILAVAGQPSTGDLIIGGSFTNVGGVTAQFLARITPDGLLDPNFNPHVNGTVNLIVIQPDNKILIAGDFNTVGPNGTYRNGLARLNADGTLDGVFNPNPNVNGSIVAMYVQSNGQIVLGGSFTDLQPNGASNETQRDYIARVNADGSLDASFDPEANSEVSCIAQQANGQLIVGGQFTAFQPGGGSSATAALIFTNYVARLNTNGTVDQSFNPDASASVLAVAVQGDGKILLGGSFNFLAPNLGPSITEDFVARVNSNGTIDTTFDSPSLGNTVNRIIIGSNGQIYLGGLFGTVGNVGTTYYGAAVGNFIVRLNANGTLDTSYSASLNGPIEGLFLQTDGTLYVAGDFTASGTVAVSDMVHFTSSGSLDPSFQLSSGSASFTSSNPLSSATVNAIALEAGGQTLVGGSFPTGIAGETSSNILRINMNGSADLAFNPNANGSVNSIATLGSSTPLTTQVSGLISLKSNGTQNQSFQYPTGFQITGNISALVVDPNHGGWIYIAGGYQNNSNGAVGSNLNRFSLSTGALDTNFNPNPQGTVNAIGIEADGNIIIGGAFTSINPGGGTGPVTRNYVARIVIANTNGQAQEATVDPSFDPNLNGVVSAVSVLSNGQILIGGDFTTETPNGTTTQNQIYYLALLNTDGTVDTKFDPSPNAQVFTITVQTTNGYAGDIDIGGVFTTLQPNGASTSTLRQYIARLNPDGSLDTKFDPEANSGVATIVEQPDGKLLVGGPFTTFSPGLATATVSSPVTTVQRDYLARLNVDGTVDTTFDPNPNSAVNSIALASDGSSIFVAGDFTAFQATSAAIATPRFFLALLAPTGAVISSFDPVVNSDVVRVVAQPNDSVLAIGDFTASQPNGTVVVGGNFVSTGTITDPTTGMSVPAPCIGGVAANYLAELREDGTANANFLPDPDGPVNAIAIQGDTKILVGGAFGTIQSNNGVAGSVSTARKNVARLNPDGTLDANFDPEANGPVDAIALQGNGEILIGGAFTTLEPNGAVSATSRSYLARLLPDGSLDASFSPSLAGAVNAIAVQPDGRILVAGAASGQGYFVRLNSDGTTDATFTPTINGAVNAILLQASGGYTPSGGILAQTYTLSDVATLSSAPSRILVGGSFTTVDGTACNNLARLNGDGTLDTTFSPNADGAVNAMELQPDGRLTVGGAFNSIGGQARFRLGRLDEISSVIRETLAVSTDLTSVLWTLDGGPEYNQVEFQLSTDDTTWTNLGQAVRVAATSDWILTGINLPAEQLFYVRAIGSEPTTQFGSSGLVLFTAAFTGGYLAVGSATSVSAVVGQPFVYFIGATNAPTSFAATGLPAGLSLDPETGVISGIPTAPGTYSVPVSAANAFASTSTTLTFTIAAPSNAAPVPPLARLASVSANGYVSNADPLIAGLVIAGGAPKTVLLRAAGPSLTNYGIANPLSNPTLSLFNTSGQLILTATSWGGNSALAGIFDQLGAFPFATGSADAAVVTTLAPGGYTVVVSSSGAPGSTNGVALAEVYDADYDNLSLPQRIVGLSGRGVVGPGNTLIGGLWIDGSTPKTVLIRGAGPALAAYGIPNPLPDPVLSVFDGHGNLIASNEGWGTQASLAGSPYPAADAATVANDIAVTGDFAFPSNSLDTAVVLTLPPGGYTGVISSASGQSGTALFEVYEVP
jgi:uncharacterized delta-60 repeat protein